MGTKWKNKVKIGVWLFLFTFGLSGVISIFTQGTDYLKNYFHTDQFEYQLEQFISNLNIYELNNLSKEEVKSLLTVSDQEIEEHRYRYGDLSEQIVNIQAQYESRIEEALANDNEQVAELLISERDEKIEDISKNFKSDEHIREKILIEKEQQVDEYFHQLDNDRSEFLKLKSSFIYYLRDTETGEVFTNVALEAEEVNDIFTKQDLHFIRTYPSNSHGYLVLPTSLNNAGFAFDDQMFAYTEISLNRTYEGKVAVPNPMSVNSPIKSDYDGFQQLKFIYVTFGTIGGMVLLLSLFILKRKYSTVRLERGSHVYEKIPIDLRLILFLISIIISLSILSANIYRYPNIFEYFISYIDDFLIHLFLSMLFVGLTIIQALYLKETMKQQETWPSLWRSSFTLTLLRMVQGFFLNRRTGTQVFVLLFVVFSFGFGFLLVFLNPIFLILFAIAFLFVGLPTVIIIMRRVGYFNLIMNNVEQIKLGRTVIEDLPEKGKSPLATLAAQINTMKRGVKQSQQEQAKSERLKTELITNVSHDLRTPLTSIITYTELLKSQEVTEEEKNQYVQIIDRKSKRLKVLIDDLFEASKMASGNIELVKEKVDLVQLLQQALAEYDDTISRSTLQFRITNPDALPAVVDGQKMWRVFDNIISNILRYSLEHTRVYISAVKKEGQAVITFKNVTKYELGDDIDELFERFKRGDASRHTEGSGLGLAIAKSIVDLHDGRLDIEVDGDLFKVIVVITL
ncbi:sensor histidine kinase [Halalkalibacter krulwichiae]|uniref:histidine kinase n=1 Tax=Halalkalibacter krulwichiae TaxID=199441 RepID=A0A1X9M7T5_9BACI|nr:HAMP domain-containing sensor histidine kinase [Halalkalibacter krulwichiae]ARK29505.1 Sensor protein kinase WalK [Halalkalibacter krulwichiae]